MIYVRNLNLCKERKSIWERIKKGKINLFFLFLFKETTHAKLLQLCPHGLACQAPLSVEFSRQEYWSGLPCPPPGRLPGPGIEPLSLVSPASVAGFFTATTAWEACWGAAEWAKSIASQSWSLPTLIPWRTERMSWCAFLLFKYKVCDCLWFLCISSQIADLSAREQYKGCNLQERLPR